VKRHYHYHFELTHEELQDKLDNRKPRDHKGRRSVPSSKVNLLPSTLRDREREMIELKIEKRNLYRIAIE
jgi:hypothetical protein